MMPFKSGGFRLKIFVAFLLMFALSMYEVCFLTLFNKEGLSSEAWASSSKGQSRKSKNKSGKGHEKNHSLQTSELKKSTKVIKAVKDKNQETHEKNSRKLYLQHKNAEKNKQEKVLNEKHALAHQQNKKVIKKQLRHGKQLHLAVKIIPEETERVEQVSISNLNHRSRFIWPVNGYIGSSFGSRRGSYGGRSARHHDGIDIMVPTGTPVMAAANGVVRAAENQRGYGQTILIAHDDGFATLYAHNAKLLVREGKRVVRGEFVAISGSTGRATAPHLHFEVHNGGRAVNPISYLP